MRVFDAVGAFAVVAWLTLVGAYAYHAYVGAETERRSLEAGVPIQAGDSWMMLTRDDDEVGFIHETRTPIEDGWLIEYDFMINVTSFGTAQLLRTKVKATMDQGAVLKRANVSVQTASAMSFEGEAEVVGNDVILRYELAGQKRTSKVTLPKAPRLSQSAFFQLASMSDLEPGAVFEQEYFDPMVMGMTQMRFRYVRRHEIDVYDQKLNAFHFRQEVGNDQFDVYMDGQGEVYIQEMPLRIIGARVPAEFGQTRAKALERQFREKNADEGAVSVDDAIGMLRGEGGLQRNSRFVVTGFPESMSVIADGPSQKVVSRKLDEVVIDTALVAELVVPDAAALEEMATPDGRFDAVQWGVTLEVPEDMIVPKRAEKVARAIRDKVLQPEEDSSFGRAELLVEGLRRLKIPARLVYGFEMGDEGVKAHYWVQYFDGTRLQDLDPSRPTLLATTGQVQLGVALALDRTAYETQLKEIKVERLKAEAVEAPAADFN